MKVKVLEADDKGRVRLSMKAVKEQETAKTARLSPRRWCRGPREARGSIAYFATCRSRSSSSVLQSMHSVAVGRASRRFRPISTPQLSQ